MITPDEFYQIVSSYKQRLANAVFETQREGIKFLTDLLVYHSQYMPAALSDERTIKAWSDLLEQVVYSAESYGELFNKKTRPLFNVRTERLEGLIMKLRELTFDFMPDEQADKSEVRPLIQPYIKSLSKSIAEMCALLAESDSIIRYLLKIGYSKQTLFKYADAFTALGSTDILPARIIEDKNTLKLLPINPEVLERARKNRENLSEETSNFNKSIN